jgi:hypothetical protein
MEYIRYPYCPHCFHLVLWDFHSEKDFISKTNFFGEQKFTIVCDECNQSFTMHTLLTVRFKVEK